VTETEGSAISETTWRDRLVFELTLISFALPPARIEITKTRMRRGLNLIFRNIVEIQMCRIYIGLDNTSKNSTSSLSKSVFITVFMCVLYIYDCCEGRRVNRNHENAPGQEKISSFVPRNASDVVGTQIRV